jgi:hypothetical protein
LEEARQAYKRALMASPQRPFLLRELSSIERRIGDLPSALQHAQQAAQLEPTDVRTLTLLAQLYEQQGDLGAAVKTYEAAAALEPSDEIDTRIEDLREKMPLEFRQIETSPAVSRAQLAALFGVHLGDLIKRSLSQNPVVITDARASWAEPWIMEVTRVGVMEVYGNHTFQPGAVVRRSDLALATSKVLSLIAAEQPALAASWRTARRRFPDVSAGHLAYPAASLAVEAGVMRPLEDGSFQLARAVTGSEAVAAVKKLEDLAESRGR